MTVVHAYESAKATAYESDVLVLRCCCSLSFEGCVFEYNVPGMEIVNILLQKNAFILNREVVRKINLR
jgi:hypothetical protein